MKALVKSLLKRTPYTLQRRSGLNRFQASEEAVAGLARRGFAPDFVLDGGANVGDFTKTMLTLFPAATIHAVEPQPGCAGALDAIAKPYEGSLVVHQVALCNPADDGGTLTLSTDATQSSTGAHVVDGPSSGAVVSVPCITIDRLTAPARVRGGRWFVKLDLQGYELRALAGAKETLKQTDVVLTEVSFYAQAYEPPIADLVAFLAVEGFELYDIASLYARPRDNRPRQGDFIFIRRDCALAADRAWS